MKKITIDPQNWQDLPGYQRNVLLTGADLQNPGTRVQLITIQPGATILDHYHKTSSEVYCPLQGECTLIVGAEEVVLRPGILLLIEPGDIHKLTNNSQEMFELLVFKTNSGPDDTFWTADI